MADTAALLLTELVSNAVRHGGGDSLQVSAVHDPAKESLVSAVFDGEPSMPRRWPFGGRSG